MAPNVLFLTTENPVNIKTEKSYQNWMLPQMIRDRGAIAALQSWRDPGLSVITIASYDLVTLLWCNDYHRHPIDFLHFVANVLVPAQKLNPKTRIFNDPSVVMWNTDKHYLADLAKAGFRTPKTQFVNLAEHSRSSLTHLIGSCSGLRPIVLKPCISASGQMTHLIKNPQAITAENLAFLDLLLSESTSGNLIIQEYEEAILQGEYSLIFINGLHTHTILKTPQKGEFRCQGEYGGAVEEISLGEVPRDAIEVAYRLWRYMADKFEKIVYVRIDGVMNGEHFVLMEVEAIEPDLWLEAKAGSAAMDELCNVFLPRGL